MVYNWSLGVQRDIGWQLVADVAYVGNAARDQLITRQINGQPYGYAYQSSSLDPTNVSGGQAQPLPNDLLRPYRGFGSIGQREFTGYSDYHSLQFSVNRRRTSDGLSVGASYTYQMVNKTLEGIDPFGDSRARFYRDTTGANGRRPHALTINYAYEVPNLSRKWDNIVAKAVFDNWQISGITSILSGNKQGFTYGYSNVPTGTLSGTGSIDGVGSRPDVVCDPSLPRSERTFDRQFRTECIKAPADGLRLGNSLGDELQGPGFMNWDISFFKNVPMGGDAAAAVPRRALQRLRHRPVERRQHRRDVRLQHRRADEHELRQAVRLDVQRPPHPARREVHVLNKRPGAGSRKVPAPAFQLPVSSFHWLPASGFRLPASGFPLPASVDR